MLLLGAAILFGGGGTEGPVNNGIIYAASGFLLLILVAAHASGTRPLPREAILPLWLLVAILVSGSIQLIPLPPGLWRELPGRDLAVSSLALVSADQDWRPLSLDPEATRRALASLLLPAALMLYVLGATCRQALLLVRIILAGAFLSATLGVLQIAAGYPDWLMPYKGLADLPTGLFANINHQAAFLLAAIICIGLCVRLDRPDGFRAWLGGFNPAWLLLPYFAVMVLATQSRAGSLLLIPAFLASLVVGLGRPSRLFWFAGLLGTFLLGLVLAAMLLRGEELASIQALLTDKRRSAILPDVLFTSAQYWPLGSGLGTFVDAFAANENLDLAGNEFVNHAHNDLLELIVETGLAGAALLLIAAGAVIARLIEVYRRGRPNGRQVAALWAGFLILSLFLVHSLVDYPARMASISAIAGIALGLVFAPLPDRFPPEARSPHGRWIFAASAVLASLFAVPILGMFIAQAAVRGGDGPASARLRPQNGAGLAVAAEQQLAAHRPAEARLLASRAIVRSPLSSRAVRVLAIARDLDQRGGMQAWRVASAMGWRDGPTQYWAMQQALANKEYETAAIRADAFLRTAYRGLRDRVGAVRILATDAGFRKELVRRLDHSPPWTAAFFNVDAETPSPQVKGVSLVLQQLSAGTSRPNFSDAARTIRVLILNKQFGDAVQLYRTVAGPNADASMRSLAFDQPMDSYLAQANPFDWTFRGKAGSITSVEQSGGKRVLMVGTNGRKRHQHAVRYAALAPGSYRLRFAMRGNPETPEIFGIAVVCAQNMQRLAASPSQPLASGDFEAREIRFAVPATCPMLLIAIESNWTDRPSEAEFADLALSS